jgi:hypothetical protein
LAIPGFLIRFRGASSAVEGITAAASIQAQSLARFLAGGQIILVIKGFATAIIPFRS